MHVAVNQFLTISISLLECINMSDKAKDEAKTITRESADILDKKYGGFTGKQILVGIVGILVITKLMK